MRLHHTLEIAIDLSSRADAMEHWTEIRAATSEAMRLAIVGEEFAQDLEKGPS